MGELRWRDSPWEINWAGKAKGAKARPSVWRKRRRPKGRALGPERGGLTRVKCPKHGKKSTALKKRSGPRNTRNTRKKKGGECFPRFPPFPRLPHVPFVPLLSKRTKELKTGLFPPFSPLPPV